MIQRCTNPKCTTYYKYGGRGIKVCERWHKFENFLADMGERPSKEYTIDRFPAKDGNYEPGNCRWATKKEQGRNTKQNVMIEYNGQTKNISEWADSTGMKAHTIAWRLAHGWSPDRIFGEPVQVGRRRGAVKSPPCPGSG